MLDKLANIEAAERQLNSYLDRRAAKVREDRPGQAAANEEVDRQRARESRRTHNLQIIHAKAWAEYFGGLALAAHYRAPFFAAKKAEALDLVRELESNRNEGGTAA